MYTLDSPTSLRRQIATWRESAQTVAFVPTMGNLHAGHLQLVKRARVLADRVVVSIYVNPAQFGPDEDFRLYPRTLEADQAKLRQLETDLVFTPDTETLYPGGIEQSTWVDVPGVSDGLCGAFRPGHFAAVATVVARLFNLVSPDIAVFGKKDYQQLAVIRKMTAELCFPIRIEAVDTIRDPDGLALSSRNQYLSHEERGRATALYQALCAAGEALKSGRRDFDRIESNAVQYLEKKGFRPEYVSIREKNTLADAATATRGFVVLAAGWLGRARLIDNLEV